MINSFTAIDFETAQGCRHSICAVGLVRIENGIITYTYEKLVQPPDNYYLQKLTDDIHGISAQDTINAPTFNMVWPEIEPYITNQTVVAHNGFGFDFQCLEKTLAHYGLQAPAYEKYCSYRIFKSNLASLCKLYKIPLNHHDALSDAKACAELFLIYLETKR